MYTTLECMRKIALHLLPVMPGTAETMLEQLGQKPPLPASILPEESSVFGLLEPGTILASSSNLFPRVEKKKPGAERESAAPASRPPAPSPSAPPAVSYEDFRKLDLRVGSVLAAERHPEADKLLRLEIDLGEEAPRQIISGLAGHFTPESLVGKQVVVVANLTPRTLRGLESRGMVLTADSPEGLRLLGVSGPVPPGGKVA
jgi:methionyl-tRNA synthetase